MRKVGFTDKVKATARIVTNKYLRVGSGPKRPVISKPVRWWTMLTDIDGLPFTHPRSLPFAIYETSTMPLLAVMLLAP